MGRRILFFIIGIGVGLLLVKLFFGRRDDIKFNYMPNTRVVNLLTKHTFLFTEAAHCQANCLQLDRNQIRSLVRKADVDFGESNVRGVEEKTYILEADSSDLLFRMQFRITDTIATLDAIRLDGVPCPDCL